MKAKDLYDKLEKDFIVDGLTDNWAMFMGSIDEYMTDSFKERSIGLVCDFTDEIKRVYTAVFPTDEVMTKILEDGVKDALLFMHHPSVWDIRGKKSFYQMDKEMLKKFKDNRISIYILHVPLDNYGQYSTSKTLADVLGLEIETPFKSYCGALSGVIGKTTCKTIEELNSNFSKVLGHNTKLYKYGKSTIRDGRVAIVAGGGNSIETVKEMIENKVDVLITGVSTNTSKFFEVHEFEKNNCINVLGGTHYSTERFTSEKMCEYFKNISLPSEFIPGEPVYEDM